MVPSLAPGNKKLPKEAKRLPLFIFTILYTSPAPS